MGRGKEITNHFVVEDLQVHGYTTEDNVYLQLNSKNVDLVEFKKSAIRYIGLSLSLERLNSYISIYKEISEKFNIKIEGIDYAEVVEEGGTGVEIPVDDDSNGGDISVDSNTDTPNTGETIENEVVEDDGVFITEEDLPEITIEEPIEEILEKAKAVNEVVEKPVRTRRAASRTKNTKIGATPKK